MSAKLLTYALRVFLSGLSSEFIARRSGCLGFGNTSRVSPYTREFTQLHSPGICEDHSGLGLPLPSVVLWAAADIKVLGRLKRRRTLVRLEAQGGVGIPSGNKEKPGEHHPPPAWFHEDPGQCEAGANKLNVTEVWFWARVHKQSGPYLL